MTDQDPKVLLELHREGDIDELHWQATLMIKRIEALEGALRPFADAFHTMNEGGAMEGVTDQRVVAYDVNEEAYDEILLGAFRHAAKLLEPDHD